MLPFNRRSTALFYLTVFLLITACASTEAPSTIENVTADGLVKIQDSNETVVFMKPDTDLNSYSNIRIVDCAIALRDSWQQDESSRIAGSGIMKMNRISEADVIRFKSKLVELFRTEFTEQLSRSDNFTVVGDSGENTLIMRPAIVDLDIPAGEYRSISRTRRLSPTSGTGILYLELLDSVTGELLLRVVNQRDGDWTGTYQVIDSPSDFQIFGRMLRDWSVSVSERLDYVHANSLAVD